VNENTKYKVGVALSGGGARGFAHAGALYALEEFGLKPDIIAGVSAGSIAASMYGAGISPLDMMKLFFNNKFSDFAEICVPKDGFFRLNGFKSFLRKNLPVQNLEECRIPTVICATDLDDCIPVQWRKGAIAERVLASCAMPIVFKPVKIEGVNYVDGGVLHNLPSWAIRNECEMLIGVNVSPIVKRKAHTGTIIDIATRSYHLMSRINAEGDMALCDVVVTTDSIADLTVFNMHEKERAFKSGYASTKKALLESGIIVKK
jgi:NTE family protein